MTSKLRSTLPATRDFSARAVSLLPLVLLLSIGLATLTPSISSALEDPRDDYETRVFEPQYLDAKEVLGVLSQLRIEYRALPSRNSVVAFAPAEKLDGFARILDQLDRPSAPKTKLHITVAIIAASQRPITEVTGQAVPAAIEPALADLRKRFGYRHFAVADNVFLALTDGQGGAAEGGYTHGEARIAYGLALEAHALPRKGGSRTIRLEDVGFHSQDYGVPREQRRLRAAFDTNLEVTAGQPAIIGKASPVGSESALVLIALAEIVP